MSHSDLKNTPVWKFLIKLNKTNIPYHIGGSMGLLIHGATFNRKIGSNDLDIILPYYIHPKVLLQDTDYHYNESCESKSSGNDFDYTLEIYSTSDKKSFVPDESIKLDIKIDPIQSYDFIDFEGETFRVSSFINILDSKLKYAKKGNKKHLNDIKYMLLKK